MGWSKWVEVTHCRALNLDGMARCCYVCKFIAREMFSGCREMDTICHKRRSHLVDFTLLMLAIQTQMIAIPLYFCHALHA